jgi:hypothetical protein
MRGWIKQGRVAIFQLCHKNPIIYYTVSETMDRFNPLLHRDPNDKN